MKVGIARRIYILCKNLMFYFYSSSAKHYEKLFFLAMAYFFNDIDLLCCKHTVSADKRFKF